MKIAHHPPELVMRAYASLVDQVFIDLRGRLTVEGELNIDLIQALADAFHNISGILTDYGTWIDDMKYRELYLRDFDKKWAYHYFSLEEFIDEKVNEFSKE